MTIALLAKYGIELATTAPGRHYTTCPRCSKDRSKAHQGAKVLGITISPDDSIHWGCNHCGWRGPEKGSGARSTKIEITYDYHDADGTLLFQKVRNPFGSKSRFFCRRPDGRGGWVNNTKDVTKPLYRLPEVIEAIKAGHPIAIAEGEKDVNSLWAIGVAATCNFDGAADVVTRPKWKASYSEMLRGADLIVFNDNDGPGFSHADVICRMSHGVAKRVRRLDLAPYWPEIPKGGDVSDWLAAGGEHTPEKLRALIEAAPDYAAVESAPEVKPESVDDTAELEKLARMTLLDYERARREAGKKLGIARLSLLDTLVKSKRSEFGLNGDGKQGRPISFPEIEPWPEPVDGAALLDEIDKAIGLHVIMPEHSRVACALWVPHTYLLQYFQVTPRLAVHSPVHGCGKTTLLDVLHCLVQRPKVAASVTTATVLRIVEKYHPTMLIDEAESALTNNEELRKVVDSGHRRNGVGHRSVGDDHETREFSTYTPLAIALIGKRLPTTTTDRSIVINLQRRKQNEKITRFRIGRTTHLDELARKIVRWIADNGERCGGIDPQIPDGLYNRIADNWEPLMMVAEAVGGDWPAKARAAAAATGEQVEESGRLEVLLSDIRDTFTVDGTGEMSSSLLAKELAAIEGRPWAEYGKAGKPITPNKLAQLLKAADIAPTFIGPKSDRCRGYTLGQFKDAFERMLTPEKGVFPENGVSKRAPRAPSYKPGTSPTFQSVHLEPGARSEKSQKPPQNGQVHAVHGSESVFPGNAPSSPSDGGTSAPSNGDATAGLSSRTIQELADEYQDRTYAAYQEVGSSDADYRRPIDAWLRKRLGEMVFREHIEGEFERVIDEVFAV